MAIVETGLVALAVFVGYREYLEYRYLEYNEAKFAKLSKIVDDLKVDIEGLKYKYADKLPLSERLALYSKIYKS